MYMDIEFFCVDVIFLVGRIFIFISVDNCKYISSSEEVCPEWNSNGRTYAKWDILGIILFMMMNGDVPFNGKHGQRYLIHTLNDGIWTNGMENNKKARTIQVIQHACAQFKHSSQMFQEMV